MFNRSSSWTLQLPELSKSRRFAQDADLKKFYELTEEIRDEMTNIMESKRRTALQMERKKPVLKKNDRVRIKKFITNDNKKAFRPFSETIWRVMSVNPHTNTCFLQEEAADGFQPRIRKIHTRFLRKVSQKAPKMGDDLELVDTNELKPNNENLEKIREKSSNELESSGKKKIKNHVTRKPRKQNMKKKSDQISVADKQLNELKTLADKMNMKKQEKDIIASKGNNKTNKKKNPTEGRNHSMKLRTRKKANVNWLEKRGRYHVKRR